MNVELLRKVATHISEEPRRFLMDSFIDRPTENYHEVIDLDAPNVPAHPFPKCGTAACIAGWAVLLEDGKPSDEVRQRATALLDLDGEQSSRLFYVDEWPEDFGDQYQASTTPEDKVKTAVARIEHFIATKGKE